MWWVWFGFVWSWFGFVLVLCWGCAGFDLVLGFGLAWYGFGLVYWVVGLELAWLWFESGLVWVKFVWLEFGVRSVWLGLVCFGLQVLGSFGCDVGSVWFVMLLAGF